MIYSFLIIADVLLAVAVVTLILLNRGHGAEVGAAFGGSATSASMFGSKGVTPFITKLIAVLAGLFLMNSLSLAYFANFQYVHKSVIEKIDTESWQQPRGQTDTGDIPDEFDNADEIAPDVPN